jgi:hypothetical protein
LFTAPLISPTVEQNTKKNSYILNSPIGKILVEDYDNNILTSPQHIQHTTPSFISVKKNAFSTLECSVESRGKLKFT